MDLSDKNRDAHYYHQQKTDCGIIISTLQEPTTRRKERKREFTIAWVDDRFRFMFVRTAERYLSALARRSFCAFPAAYQERTAPPSQKHFMRYEPIQGISVKIGSLKQQTKILVSFRLIASS